MFYPCLDSNLRPSILEVFAHFSYNGIFYDHRNFIIFLPISQQPQKRSLQNPIFAIYGVTLQLQFEFLTFIR